MTDKLRVHVEMKNGRVLDFTMDRSEVARFMEELEQDGYRGEAIPPACFAASDQATF